VNLVLLFLLLGLGAGGVYALLGLGLVLKYRATQVIDFAHASVAMFSAYVFVNLRSTGRLELPWIVLPHEIPIASAGIDVLPALAITLVYGTLLGYVLFLVVYRPLLRAAPLTKVCASVGVMLGLEAIAVLNFGTTSLATGPVLPSVPIRIASVAFPSDRLVLLGIVVVASLALLALYRFTRFGLATRASAENETGAALIGISPTAIATRNWVIASAFAALSGILITPISSLDPTSYTLFVVPALGAALVGRFASFPWTAGAGIALGIFQSEVTLLQAQVPWLPRQGLGDGVPFLLILIAMTVSARRLGVRGDPGTLRNPSLGRPTRPLATSIVCLVLGLIVLVALQGSFRAAFISSLITTCICLSLVLLTGFVGQVSLAQMSFVGFSAFVLSQLGAIAGLPFPIPALLAALTAVPLGVLIGLPALRVRGVSLAVVTLAVAAAMDALVFSNAAFSGGLGGRTIASPTFFGIDLGIAEGRDYPRIVFGVVVLVVVVLVGYAVARLRTSSTGRVLVAIRSNERAAAFVGVDVARMKLFAFALSSFIAGLGGSLLAYEQGTVSSASFATFTSLTVLAIAYVAGIGRIAGAVIAGLLFASDGLFVSFLDAWLHIGQYQQIVAGVALAFTAIQNQNGVAAELAGEKGLALRVARLRDRILPVRWFGGAAPIPLYPRVTPAGPTTTGVPVPAVAMKEETGARNP
jgi:ABC-type branched-subunit amino acid transport system permease subunit